MGMKINKNNEELPNIMKEAKSIINHVQGTAEAIEDAKMFARLCKMIRDASENTSADESRFSATSFAVNIGKILGAASPNDETLRVSRGNLLNLGGKIKSNFDRVSTLKFVLGGLNTEQGEKKEQRRKAIPMAARTKPKLSAATKTAIVEKSQTNEAKTDRYVKMTKRCLEDNYRANNNSPVCYFSFVIDPDSFGKTVENMFHISFLVKQRTALLAIGKNGMPTLEPLTLGNDDRYEEDDAQTDQAVISICEHDWMQLKSNLNITKKTIIIS